MLFDKNRPPVPEDEPEKIIVDDVTDAPEEVTTEPKNKIDWEQTIEGQKQVSTGQLIPQSSQALEQRDLRLADILIAKCFKLMGITGMELTPEDLASAGDKASTTFTRKETPDINGNLEYSYFVERIKDGETAVPYEQSKPKPQAKKPSKLLRKK